MPPKRNGAPYRRVLVNYWTDPDVKNALTRDEKLFFQYLFTNPHSHPCGLYSLPPLYVESELGFSRDEMRNALDGPLAAFATYDWRTEEIFVHAMAEHQLDGSGLHGSDNRIKWVATQLQMAHSRSLLEAFHHRYSGWNLPWSSILGEETEESHPKGLAKPLNHAEKEGPSKPLPGGVIHTPGGAIDGGVPAPLDPQGVENPPGPTREAEKEGACEARARPRPSIQGVIKPLASPPVAGGREGKQTAKSYPTRRDADRATILEQLHLGSDTVTVAGKPVSMELEMHIRDSLVAQYGEAGVHAIIPKIRAVEEFGPDVPISLRIIEQRPEVATRALAAAALDGPRGPGADELGATVRRMPGPPTDAQAEAKRKLEQARAAQ